MSTKLKIWVEKISNPELEKKLPWIGLFDRLFGSVMFKTKNDWSRVYNAVIDTGTPIEAYIEITYSADDIPKGSHESTLRLYYWDEQTHAWQKINETGVDTERKVLWARVSHLTIFAPHVEKAEVERESNPVYLPLWSLVY
jgi:hypothetical protein